MSVASSNRRPGRKTVLIVEDDDDFRRVLSLTFRWAGFDTVVAGNGLAAIALLERSRVDAVVLDLSLPGFDGLVVRDEIAANPLTRDVAVIIVTGSEKPLKDVSPSCVLRKPVTPERVLATVVKCLREARRATRMTHLLGPTPSVLVTDDTAAIRDVVGRVLAADGYVVETAAEGAEALEKIGKRLFDLYLVDVAMPMMNGQELAAVIRSYHPSAKVLYITAYSERLFQDTVLLKETEAFLEKPFTPEGLRAAVSLLLFGHLRGPQAGETP
jgi:CheY-like chemotaxis protein